MNTGIYSIRQKSTGREYVGSAVNIVKRWKDHRRQATAGRHHSRFLQRAWSKCGSGDFEFRVLLVCARDDLIQYEQACMDGLEPVFNTSPTAGSQLGFKMSDDAKRKMSVAAKRTKNRTGIPHTPESKAKISASRMGKGGGPRTLERRRKISEALTGRKLPEETRKKISESLRGHKQSAETIAKRVKKLRGRKMPEGFGAMISARLKGVKKSPEAVQNLRNAKASLTPEQVREIRTLAGLGVKHREIAQQFGITVNNVSVIKTKQTYAWVT
jgi:group I intron endonuclease